ncbi:MAG: hypothetical protein KJP04_00415, partial [Arenicella sp.]|nr:hypothetical protein [Arenicella sp.]
EVYGFMVSGFARFNLNDKNIEERSNVFFYEWGTGPTDAAGAKDFTEVPRNPDGTPNTGPTPDPEEEGCVDPPPPTPVVNLHQYTGTANGTVDLAGAINQTLTYEDNVVIDVSDDRSLTFAIGGDSFNATVAQDDSFSGMFTYGITADCPVDITVNGLITGTSVSGSTSGSKACLIDGLPVLVTFDATFNATSPTAPSYLDQRAPLSAPSVCKGRLMALIISILLDDD